jgi:hypothetical protein
MNLTWIDSAGVVQRAGPDSCASVRARDDALLDGGLLAWQGSCGKA